MITPLLILGVVLLISAAIFAIIAWNTEGRLALIKATPTTTAQDVYGRYRHDGGAFGQACEVAGVVEADYSFDGPLSGQPCVIYSHTVTWEDWSQQNFGRRSVDGMARTGGSTEVDDRHVPTFWVRDATGRVRVDPLLAEFDLKDIDERYEVMTASASERRSWRTEKALPVGHQVYVLGYIGEKDGEPILGHHQHDKSKRFIISYRSERDLTHATSLRTNLFYILAGLCGIGGIAALMWQMLQRGR
jgi:hypothetical protein